MDRTRRKVIDKLSQLKARHSIKHHPLTIEDFYRVCESRNIEIFRIHSVQAFVAVIEGVTYISLGLKIDEKELPFVAFHELGHCLMHRDAIRPASELLHEIESEVLREIEADMFAEMATNLKRLER